MKALIPLLLTACMSAFGVSCKKAENSSSGDTPATTIPRLATLYKDTLVGTWTWSRTYQFVGAPQYDTFYSLPDTVFSISPVDDTTLSVFGRNCIYTEDPYSVGMSNLDTANEIWYEIPYDRYKSYMKFNRKTDSLIISMKTGAGINKYSQYVYRTRVSH